MTESAVEMLVESSADELRVMKRLLEIKDIRLKFALEHHRNTRDEPMDFDHFPHIRQLYNSTAREIVLMGSVQSMKSEFVIIDHFAAAYTGLSIFFVVPKFEARTTYVQNRINRCVENVKEYKRIIGAGFFDSVALKSFGRGVVKYVGSNVLSDFKEFPADMLVVEEVDECMPDNVDYALDRLRASRYQFKRYLGNPKIKGRGIHAYFNESDQREWEVPCLECEEYSELDWFKVVAEPIEDKDGSVVDYLLRDKDWEVGCHRDIKLVCPKCGGELERASLRGRWVPKNPGHPVEGYHLSMMCSPINSISGMWLFFLKAVPDPSLMQQFYNSYLGLPYEAIGNRVTEALLDSCIDEEYEFVTLPDRAYIKGDEHPGPCSIGIDVGAFFDVRISYIEPRGRRRAVFMGKVKSVDDLHDLIVQYNVEKAVMDSMPEVTLAQDFQETAECEVWLCRYMGSGTDKRRSYNINDRVILTDRTDALDRSFAHLRQKKNILPKNYASILGGQYVNEMCTSVRHVTEDAKGIAKYEWSQGKDHQRHCDTYDLLAAYLMNDAIVDEVFIG